MSYTKRLSELAKQACQSVISYLEHHFIDSNVLIFCGLPEKHTSRGKSFVVSEFKTDLLDYFPVLNKAKFIFSQSAEYVFEQLDLLHKEMSLENFSAIIYLSVDSLIHQETLMSLDLCLNGRQTDIPSEGAVCMVLQNYSQSKNNLSIWANISEPNVGQAYRKPMLALAGAAKSVCGDSRSNGVKTSDINWIVQIAALTEEIQLEWFQFTQQIKLNNSVRMLYTHPILGNMGVVNVMMGLAMCYVCLSHSPTSTDYALLLDMSDPFRRGAMLFSGRHYED